MEVYLYTKFQIEATSSVFIWEPAIAALVQCGSLTRSFVCYGKYTTQMVTQLANLE